MKILLVDDSELFLDLEKSYLDRESFFIKTARSGPEALESIRSDRPDLVILDLIMPGMDGDAVCRQVKSDPATSSIPIVMSSSANSPELRSRCHAAGCDAFVSKPLKRDELLEAMERTLVIAKRRFPRVPAHLPCRVSHAGKDAQVWMHTLSKGGTFLQMAPLPEAGEELEITFSLPGAAHPINARGMVRWQGKVRDGGPLGVGIEFVGMEDLQRDLIGDYVKQKLAEVGSLKGFA